MMNPICSVLFFKNEEVPGEEVYGQIKMSVRVK